jgi:hypothetical protein
MKKLLVSFFIALSFSSYAAEAVKPPEELCQTRALQFKENLNDIKVKETNATLWDACITTEKDRAERSFIHYKGKNPNSLLGYDIAFFGLFDSTIETDEKINFAERKARYTSLSKMYQDYLATDRKKELEAIDYLLKDKAPEEKQKILKNNYTGAIDKSLKNLDIIFTSEDDLIEYRKLYIRLSPLRMYIIPPVSRTDKNRERLIDAYSKYEFSKAECTYIEMTFSDYKSMKEDMQYTCK